MSQGANEADIDDVAAAWAVRLDCGDLSEVEQFELDTWLAADIRHQGALVRAQAIWGDIDRIVALDGGASRAPARPRWTSDQMRIAASFVAVALVVGAGATVFDARFAGREQADIGEVRRIALDDGSTVTLNTASVIRVRYGGGERRIELERGEAYFQVAHDARRPFVVRAGDVTVRALGTRFDVRMQPSGQVAVTVTEGKVKVTRAREKAAPPEVHVVAREQHLVAPVARPVRAAALPEAELNRRLSWQEGLLVFDGQSVAEAAAEVNRYSALKVRIEDPAMASRSFVGVFRIGDTRAFAYAAASAFRGRVEEGDDTLAIVAR